MPLSASERQSGVVLSGGAGVARRLPRSARRDVAHLRFLPVILTCVTGTKTQKTVLWAL